jgi:hypothetical protein
VQNDLKGRWYVYSSWIDDFAENCWSRALVVIKPDGTIKKSGRFTDCDGGESPITGGKLRVSSNCVVKGKIEVDGGTAFIDHAALQRDSLFISGVGHDEEGARFTFQGVRK